MVVVLVVVVVVVVVVAVMVVVVVAAAAAARYFFWRTQNRLRWGKRSLLYRSFLEHVKNSMPGAPESLEHEPASCGKVRKVCRWGPQASGLRTG